MVVDPNKAIGVGLTAAQVAGEVRTALVGQEATKAQVDPAQDPLPVFVQVDPAQVNSVETLRALPVGTVATVPLGTIAAVDRGRGPGQHHPRRPGAGRHGLRRDRQQRHRRRLHGGPGRRSTPWWPTARSRTTSTSSWPASPAAERGLRQPLRLDGRRHPPRLRDDGADLQLADHAVHHPVQPPARHDRRLPGALHHRQADRRQRPHRVPDAHRDRRDQRDRPARPRRAAATRRGTPRRTP